MRTHPLLYVEFGLSYVSSFVDEDIHLGFDASLRYEPVAQSYQFDTDPIEKSLYKLSLVCLVANVSPIRCLTTTR